MAETWFIADHHFQHKRILEVTDKHGLLIRPEFEDVDHMDQFMVDCHNKVVGSKDTVWFLGDVTWKENKKAEDILKSLKGDLKLCIGNHDDGKWLAPFFSELVLWKHLRDIGIMLSHVPLSEADISSRTKFNVHGHIHELDVLDQNGSPDPRYMCVSVEQVGYEPVHIEMVKEFLR